MKRYCANIFLFTIVLIFLTIFGTLAFSWAQSPRHSRSLEISELQKGEFYLLSKKPGEALKVFKDLWEQEPQNSYAVRGIVRSYQSLDKAQEVVSLLSEYFEKHSQSSSAAYGLGYAFYLQGKFEESRKILNMLWRSITCPQCWLSLRSLMPG